MSEAIHVNFLTMRAPKTNKTPPTLVNSQWFCAVFYKSFFWIHNDLPLSHLYYCFICTKKRTGKYLANGLEACVEAIHCLRSLSAL